MAHKEYRLVAGLEVLGDFLFCFNVAVAFRVFQLGVRERETVALQNRWQPRQQAGNLWPQGINGPVNHPTGTIVEDLRVHPVGDNPIMVADHDVCRLLPDAFEDFSGPGPVAHHVAEAEGGIHPQPGNVLLYGVPGLQVAMDI